METQSTSIYTGQKIKSHFGEQQRYFAIDGGCFPPKGLAVFEKENTLFFITLGMSILAQPRVELYAENPQQFRRIELGMAIDKAVLAETSIENIGQFMSSIAAIPWDQLCWFGHGHTLKCTLFRNSKFNNVLLVDRAPDSIAFPPYEDDPVKLLWLVLITDEEFAYQHSAGDLIEKLKKSQNTWVHKPRSSVVLFPHSS